MVKSIGNVQKDAQVRAVASGALANGDTVVVNADGTVSVISETGTPANAGSPVVFESANVEYPSSVYDANAQKIVIAYKDRGNSNYGTAVVGTVSGSSISFGTPVVFNSANIADLSAAYDANAQKVVLAYKNRNGTNYGTAIVGTVSGTSISFGSSVVFRSSNSTSTAIVYDANAQKVVISYHDYSATRGTAIVGTVSGTSISFGSSVVFNNNFSLGNSMAYDTASQKIVIAYRDANNSNYGTAIVGTVSGTSISFGSSVVFNTGTTYHIEAVYDANAQKVVIPYVDDGNSDYGTAIVGTVSGTSISFGSEVVFATSSGSIDEVVATYDASAQKVVIAYQDEGDTNKGLAIVGTVSGTSISFSSPVFFDNNQVDRLAIAYDSNEQKVVISYAAADNSNYGTASVFQPASLNLTSENFIGFSDGAYADTQSAVINSTCSVDRSQTSLTAGQTYYVQTDGSLGLTAADPSVEAGTAISATEILVKG